MNKHTQEEFGSLYGQALQEYLGGAGETALRRAYELGRKAIANDLGILDMVSIYDEAAKPILREVVHVDEKIEEKIHAMRGFLMESLSPFEITHRSFRESNAALHRLNETLEEETKRIAHILHDNATQLLAAVHIALADLLQELPPNLATRVTEIRGHLDEIDVQLRRLSHELRPTILDDLGLVPALEFLAEGMTKRTGLLIAVEGSTNGRLLTSIETTVYRITQEALNNASKHARAKRAMVQISREPHLIRCAIRDNGIGFNVREAQSRKGDRGLGLTAIRERLNAVGGTLQIKSSSQRGTEILITIPLED